MSEIPWQGAKKYLGYYWNLYEKEVLFWQGMRSCECTGVLRRCQEGWARIDSTRLRVQ